MRATPEALRQKASRDMDAPVSSTERVFFPSLDGLRFVAFLLVYAEHGFGVVRSGQVGVAFFFVLSGFLITYLLLVEGERRGRVDIRAFYIRRTLRIWPLYFCVLAFAYVLYPVIKAMAGIHGQVNNGGPLPYLLFLGNFDVLEVAGRQGNGAGFINVLWSISVEEQFYLLWPLLLRRPSRDRTLIVLLSVIAVSFGFRLAHAADAPTLYFHTLSVISDMAIGGLAAYSWRRWPRLRALVEDLPGSAVAMGYLAAVLFIVTQPLWGPGCRIVLGLIFVAVVLEQNFCRRSPFKMSDAPLLCRLGRYTYGLYLLHMIVLFVLGKSLLLIGLDPKTAGLGLLAPLLGLPLTLLAAWVSYTYVESPFLRLKSRFSPVASGPA